MTAATNIPSATRSEREACEGIAQPKQPLLSSTGPAGRRHWPLVVSQVAPVAQFEFDVHLSRHRPLVQPNG